MPLRWSSFINHFNLLQSCCPAGTLKPPLTKARINRSIPECDHDKRQKRIYLTKEGKEFKEYIIKKARKGEKQAIKGLTQKEVITAKKVLQTIYNNLNKAHNHDL